MRGTATVSRTTPLANGGMDPPPEAPSWPDASCVRPRRPARTRASASATDDAEPRWTCWHVSTGGRAGLDASPIAGSDGASSVVGATTCTASAETAGAVVLVAASKVFQGHQNDGYMHPACWVERCNGGAPLAPAEVRALDGWDDLAPDEQRALLAATTRAPVVVD